MASCKDCIHFESCKNLYETHGEGLSGDSYVCDFFKDQSRFVELPYAEWVEDEDMYGDPIYRCSNCGEHFILEEGTPTDNGYFYCPDCGAHMSKEVSE